MRSFHFASSEKKSHHAAVLRPCCSSATTQNATRFALRLIVLSTVFASFLLSPNVTAQDPSPQQPAQTRGAQVEADDRSPQSTDTSWRDHKDYALLFATDDYDSWPPLSNPIPDAHAVADELRDNYGFDVNVIENPNRDRIVGTLRDYGKKQYGKADQLFIFFAGHGLYDEVFKQGYIVARDSRMDDANRLTYESYDDLRQIINSIPAKHIFLVMDACFSGTFDRRIGESTTRGSESYASFSFQELFANKAALSTRKYLTSGGKEYVPDGLPGHHSPFAAQLLNVLRTYGGKQGYLTFNGVLTGVEDTKPQPVWGEWGDNEPGSEFILASKRFVAGLISGQPASQPTAQPPSSGEVANRGDSDSLMARRPSIAVLGFENVSTRPENAWLSNAISEELRTDLAAGEKLRAITGENVERAKTDLSLKNASGYAPDTLSKIYNVLGSDYVVTGSYLPLGTPSDSKIRVELRLQNAKSGDMLAEAAESGSVGDLPDLVTRLGGRLRDKLGIGDPSPIEASNAKASAPSNPEAVREYTEGLTKLRGYDLLGARDLLDRAIKSDPKFALAHEALADTWAELGYDQNATDEARTAVSLSGGLSYENRRAIEGRYRQMTAEWDRAVEIYHSLWTVFPDETEYGLELAEVQTAAGKGRDALITLTALRQSEGASSEHDPRIDYAEALAAGSLADVSKEHAAAAQAATIASQQGERLLASEAYWRDCVALFELGNTQAAETACQNANQGASSGAGLKFQARSLTVLANIREEEGQASEAMELRTEALRLAREIGSRKDIIGALMNLAISFDVQGKSDEARADYQEAIGIAKEIGDKQQLAALDFNLAANYYTQGDYTGAKPLYEQSLEIARQTGDKAGVANGLQSIGLVDFELGDLAAGRKNTEDALAEARKAGLQGIDAISLDQLGDIQLTQADFAGTRQNYEAALKLFTDRGDKSGTASARLSLANLALEEGHSTEAESLARQAAEEFQDEKLVDNEADARNTLARALLAENRLDDAQAEIRRGIDVGAQDRIVRLSLAITAARVKIRLGKMNEAQGDLAASLSDATQKKLVGLQLEIKLASAETISDHSSKQLALTTLQQEARNDHFELVSAEAARQLRSPN